MFSPAGEIFFQDNFAVLRILLCHKNLEKLVVHIICRQIIKLSALNRKRTRCFHAFMALVGHTWVGGLHERDGGSKAQKEAAHFHLFFFQVLELKTKI